MGRGGGPGAPKGNQYYRERLKDGRDKIFQTSTELLEKCLEYFEWVVKNPLRGAELVKFQGKYKTAMVPVLRMMSIRGLCIHLGIMTSSWDNYRKRKDYLEVCTRVESVIKDQQVTGAAGNLLNANIIARLLGLAENVKTEDVGSKELANHIDRANRLLGIIARVSDSGDRQDTPGGCANMDATEEESG